MNKSFRFFLSCILIFSLLVPHIPISAVGTESLDASSSATGSSTAPPAVNNCQILNYIDKEVFASGNHIKRLTDEETLSTYVFLNSDGSKTVYYLDEPVKYVDATGNIIEKDLALTESSNGYITTQNNVTLSLPVNPSSGIRLTHADNTVSLIPQGGTLAGTAQKSGNTLIYPNYYGNGISLAYTPTLSGVKEDIILNSYAGTNSFTFTLNTGGLNLYQSGANWYLAETELSETRINLGQVVTYDARGRFSIGTMTAQTLIAGRSYSVTITADEEFLTAETTTYPVTIDPALTFTDGTYLSSSIVDATIYEGKPNLNTGTWQYHHIGYYDDEYGTGQTVVRLSNLITSDVYLATSANGITSAKFYVREASGNPSGTVNLYPIVTNVSWTETGITWNNKGSYGTTAYASTTLPSNKSACFDITQLVTDWKHGLKNATAGFVLVASPSNSDVESLYSSEYSTSSYRPYVSVTYKNSIQLDKSSAELRAGNTLTLTATTALEDYSSSWSSSDMAVATIRKTGEYTCEVTGVNPGTATITATLGDGSTARCTIYVTIADGIYRIQHDTLQLEIPKALDQFPVAVGGRCSFGPASLNQLWKIQHLGSGYYSIRPMFKLDMILDYSSGSVKIASHPSTTATDTLDSVPMSYRWSIVKKSYGYVFNYAGFSSQAMRPMGDVVSDGALVSVEGYSSDYSLWTLESVTNFTDQLILIDSNTGLYVNNPARSIPFGSTVSLADLGLTPVLLSQSTNVQSFELSSSPFWFAGIREETGDISADSPGLSTITISSPNVSSTVSFPITVTPPTNCVTVDVDVLYDAGFVDRYGEAHYLERIYLQIPAVQKFYWETFGLFVNFLPPTQFTSLADRCGTGIETLCTHGTCKNFSPSETIPEDSLEYHHKNSHNMLYSIPTPEQGDGNPQFYRLAFTGHKLCQSTSNGCEPSSLGLASRYYGKALVMHNPGLGATSNPDKLFSISLFPSTRTTAHEFGHLIGALDHYSEEYNAPSTEEMNKQTFAQTGKKPYSEYCLYGEKRNDLEELMICDGCKEKIQIYIANNLADTEE